MSNKIYTFPNGYSLRFALCFDKKGTKSTRFRRAATDSFHFQQAIQSKEKAKLPLLDLDTAYDYPIVAADFDNLPDGFMDWDHFEQYLYQTYSESGLVVRTPSGKCKVLFQLKMPSGVKLIRLDRMNTLKELLLPEDFPWIDEVPTALTKVYLTPAMLPKLQSWKPKFHKPCLMDAPKIPTFSELEARYTYQNLMEAAQRFKPKEIEIQGKVFDLLATAFPRMSEDTRLSISIYLVRYRTRLAQGFPLNQKLMANMIQCKQPYVAKILKKLIDMGWLKDKKFFVPGFQAKKHSTIGELRDILNADVNAETIETLLSGAIQDGEANSQYLKLNRQLSALGLPRERIKEELIKLDKQRPTNKQRKDKYFEDLTNRWTSA